MPNKPSMNNPEDFGGPPAILLDHMKNAAMDYYQQRADWVDCKRRGSEKSIFLVLVWGFWFSLVRLFSKNSSMGPFTFNKIQDLNDRF